jgi:hypothetical protein
MRRKGVEKWLRWGVYALLWFVPLAFASVELWARAVLVSVSVGMFGAWLLMQAWLVRESELERHRAEWRELRALGWRKRFWARHPRLARALQHLTTGRFPSRKALPEEPMHVYRLQNYTYCAGRRFLRTGAEFPLLLFFGLLIFQLLPMPPGMMKIVSPGTYRLYAQTLPGYGTGAIVWEPVITEGRRLSLGLPKSTDELWKELEAEEGSEPPAAGSVEAWRFSDWLPLSVYPAATLRDGLLVVSLGMVFFLCLQLFPTFERARWVLFHLVGSGFAVAFIGIVQRVSGTRHLYGFREIPYGFMGPFVNPNHFCALMELAFPVALGFAFINFIPPEQKHFRVTPDGASVVRRRRKKREFTPNDFAKGFCFCFLTVGMLVAVGLARSRGGLLVTAWGLVLFGLLFMMYLRRGQGSSLTVIVVMVGLLVALSLGAIVYLGWEEALVQEAKQIDLMHFGEEKRFYLWHDVWKGIQEFPIWGAGWGTFRTIFPYRRTVPGERSIAEHAESDILEIGLEGGLVALGLLGWAVAAVAMRSEVRLSSLHAGLGVGLANVLFHSVFDFPLRIPAVSFVFSVTAALSASLGRVQEE